jgi:peroxiredoxin (alkyl hydroperoxide reductase subunit C)
MAAEIGAPAPAFTLANVDREMVSNEDLKGSKALVMFIPFPFTGICDGEACAMRDNLAALNDMDAKVVIITVHARPTNAEWAKQNGFEFPVLSDFWPHGEVASAYGNFDENVGAATRTTYVLDEDGIVRDIIATDSLGTAREIDAQIEALRKLG